MILPGAAREEARPGGLPSCDEGDEGDEGDESDEGESFSRRSRSRLTERDLPRFPSEALFDRLARAVCRAACLPRKELYEAWEVARRARRYFRGGRVVDLAAGHGLLAYALLLLDDSSPEALAVDTRLPKSSAALAAELARTWPRLAGRVSLVEQPLETIAVMAGDLVASVHACGPLTDRVLDHALAARARVAVLPCCHDEARCDAGPLRGWMDVSLAIDATRAQRLVTGGYEVRTLLIPEEITPKNRLLLGSPKGPARPSIEPGR